MGKKTCEFKAEIRQMLDLVINSLYSKKEIFLRELVSNASDAIDRAKFLALTDKSLAKDDPVWRIDIVADKDDRSLTIADNGIGMDETELENNLGVIANSGTKAFLGALSKKKSADAPQMIGQFGVGFYAAFMVAEKVTVTTLKRGDGQKAWKWTSEGTGSYTIEEAARDKPGTSVELKLRKEFAEYLDEWRVRELIKKYSDFIAYPIRYEGKGEAAAESEVPLNTMKALWKRPKSEVKPEEYNEFYSHLTHDHEPPFRTIHMNVEGVVEFKALLFIPKEASFDMLMPNKKYGLNLYVRNVYIGSDFDLLLPDWLRFVKGVVDSADLPLNVSREMLQDDAVIRKIKSSVTNKILSELADMMKNDRASYETFFSSFGRVIKEGVYSDWENTDKIKALLLWPSAASNGAKNISLAEYVAAMPKEQTDIYYLPAEDLETAKNSPQLEALRKRNWDVLFFVDPVDQWIADNLREWDKKKLVPIDKGDLKLGDEKEQAEEKKKLETAAEELKPLLDYLQERMKDELKETRLSTRLTDSACCLVADENALSASMERMMRAMKQEVPKTLRILELNPDHPLVKRMAAMAKDGNENEKLADYADLLYGQALLAEGSQPKDAAHFSKLVAQLMVNA